MTPKKSSSSRHVIDFLKERFNYLTLEDAELMADHMEMVSFESGEKILEFGKYERYFYYLYEGLIRGYNYTDGGEEFNIFFTDGNQAFLSPDKFFNDDKKLNTFIFESITPIKVLKFDHDKLLELCSQNQGIFVFYHSTLRSITQRLYERIRLLLIENAEDRYLHLLKTRPLLVEMAQKKHLAQFLGITPNSFSRILRKFKDYK